MDKNEKLNKLKGSIRKIILNQHSVQQQQREMMNQEIDHHIHQLQSQNSCSIDKIHQEAIFSAAENHPTSPLDLTNSHEEANKLPMYKSLQVNDLVLSRYSDGKYYQAVIKSVTHSGYPSAQYDVEYINYSNERQTVSWKNLLPSPSKEEEETNSLSGNKRRRLSSDPFKDEYGRDRRSPCGNQSTSQKEFECASIADICPALLNRPKGAWKKK
jgi:hypothetical protein